MANLNFDSDSRNLTDLLATGPKTGQIPASEKESHILSSPCAWDLTTAEELAIRREKNRLAAAKCRAKKAEKFKTLNDYRQKLIEDNRKLKERNLELKTELELYKIKLEYAMMNSASSVNRFQAGSQQHIFDEKFKQTRVHFSYE